MAVKWRPRRVDATQSRIGFSHPEEWARRCTVLKHNVLQDTCLAEPRLQPGTRRAALLLYSGYRLLPWRDRCASFRYDVHQPDLPRARVARLRRDPVRR